MLNLKKLRKESGMTQAEFAKKVNLSLRGYQGIENRVNQTSYENLIKFADYFGCSIDYLLGHQTKSLLYLDSFTNEQLEVVNLVKTLDEKQTERVLGYIQGLKTKI